MSEPIKAPAPAAAGRAATKKELPEHFKGYKHVWVFIEQERGLVHPVSWELMGAGRQLADKLQVELAAVVVGPEGEATRQAAAEAFATAPISLTLSQTICWPTTATSPTPRR